MNEGFRESGADDGAANATFEALSGSDWPAPPPEAGEFRAALLAHTTSIVRQRARWRRGRRMATICLAYAAGVLTTAVLWRLPAAVVGREGALAMRSDPGESRRSAPADPRTSSHAAREHASLDAADELASLSPAELRRLVPRAPREKQVRLLSLAGDRYLFNHADVVSALDCYRQVIELTPADERQPPQPEDSWLLAELKASAQ